MYFVFILLLLLLYNAFIPILLYLHKNSFSTVVTLFYSSYPVLCSTTLTPVEKEKIFADALQIDIICLKIMQIVVMVRNVKVCVSAEENSEEKIRSILCVVLLAYMLQNPTWMNSFSNSQWNPIPRGYFVNSEHLKVNTNVLLWSSHVYVRCSRTFVMCM